ncbi:carbohydrate ABC transporter permease [Uliginosibacterium gangwonense]|uniref:carbohydrate ABC transporter permease n=2 Tax=Uliginosibacterium gangwonense TaxID=392736 RepID=UPI000370F415|nr:carbohydrate ABC transporter permease [Uliginosibacterium gangwonense]
MKSKISLPSLPILLAYLIIAVGGVMMFAPFWFMFVFATHTNTEILSVPPPLWFGTHFFENWNDLLGRLPAFWHNIGWSVYIAIATTAANLFFCSLAGYAFAMYQFRYKKLIFGLIMSTMMLPSFVGIIPTALTMSWIGWMNQPKALIVPAMVGAFGIFLMRQYIESAIPKELIDAARIDGCSEFGIYFRVILPLIGPALGTLGLLTFIGSWNNFMGPLVVMRDMDMYTIPLALRALQGTGQTPYGAISAGSAVAVLPLMILFVMASKRLISGLTAGAVKS